MNFTIKNTGENPNSLARKIGYQPIKISENEYEMTRELSSGQSHYPRFHIYLKNGGIPGDFVFSLHLDQKKPSYSQNHAHSGEYNGKTVENEAERIKRALAK